MNTKNRKSTTTSDILPAPSTLETRSTHPASPLPSHPASSIEHPASVPPKNPPIHKSNNPLTTRARCGKVARLPKEVRDKINEMLLDGLPHAKIIQKLHQTFGAPAPQSNVLPLDPADSSNSDHASRITHHEPGPGISHPASSIQHPESAVPAHPASSIQNPESVTSGIQDSKIPTFHQSNVPLPSHSFENQNGNTSLVSKIENLDLLTPHHLTTWKKFGGYRDWLKDQQRIADCKLRHELTLDLARSSEGLASYQAAPKVAVAQICQTIIDLGPDGLKDAMKDSPLNCFRLLNALARLVNSGLKCESHVIKHAAESRQKPRNGFTPDVVDQMETHLNMM
jgi:hypothetical protein